VPRARRLVVRVPVEAAGMRLDRFLSTLPELGTRSRAKALIDDGRVTVDGVTRKSAHAVRAGERIAVTVPPPEPAVVEPEALPLAVLYEDDHLLAIDKPPGMVVHPAPGARRGTVVNALLHRLGSLAAGGDPERPGIVHRLDRDTSGVLLVARTPQALEGLARQFRDRTLSKRYVAVVHGVVRPSAGVIDRAIGRHPRERKRMSVDARRGRAAVTRFEVVERFRGATLLRLVPETGRTHQLRVHLAALGHPIVGDRVYGGARGRRPASVPAPVAAVLEACPRQALHAEAIGFAHPVSGTPVEVRAPLPPDLARLLESLRRSALA
jgi:23S rRNA pseudouridine1911/1915/1917 synthase